MLEADFIINRSQCGSEDFQKVFPVPADTYRLYAAEAERQRPQLLTASVYVCLLCGHLEQFVDLPKGAPSGLDAHPPRDHLDTRS